jgi:hypothetical protein
MPQTPSETCAVNCSSRISGAGIGRDVSAKATVPACIRTV